MSYDANDSREPRLKLARESPQMQRLHFAAQQRAQEEQKSGASLGLLNFLTENLGTIGATSESGQRGAKPAGGRAVYRPRSALEAQRLDTESTTLNLMTRSTSASFKSFNSTAATSLNLKKPQSVFGEQPVFGVVTRPRPSSAIFQQDAFSGTDISGRPSSAMKMKKGSSATASGESAGANRAAFWKKKLSHLPHSTVHAFGHEKNDNSVDETVSALLRAEVAQLSLSSVGISQIPGHVMVMYELKVLLLSDNKLSSLPPAFKSLALLRLLDLSCNQFACVPRVVQHLDNLNVLLLPDNFLDCVPPFMSNCRRLEVLDVSRNHVTNVACQVAACAHLQFLGLDGNDDLIFPPKTVVRDGMERLIPYLRAFKNAVDACDSSGTLDLSGVIEAFPHCTVGADMFEADELHHEPALPKEIILCPALADVFDRIIVLDISRTGCTSAPPWDFFPAIQVAIMDGNRLSSLTIPLHQSLQQLSARGNSIRQVNAQANGATLSLSVLLLDDNLIERPPTCLRSCLSLHRLSLQGNKLVSLFFGGTSHDPADMLPMACPMLQEFDASMNQIDFDTIKDNDSASVPQCSIISMCLSNNRMTCLPKAMLMACPQITYLDVSSNSLIELPDAFLYAPQLRVLKVDINPLKSLPPSLFTSPHLNQVSRKETSMELPPQFFGEVLSDASLAAASRFSRELMLSSPKQVKAILALDRFGFQRLASSWFDAVVNMSSHSNVQIEGVVLSKNRISLLPDVFSHFRRLQALVADSNCFEKIPDIVFGLTSLTLLDFSQNRISLVQNSICELSQLQELCLGSNPILALPRTLHLMTKLTVLRIDIETLRFPPRSVLVNGLHAVKEFYQQAFYANVGCIDLSNCGIDEADPYWLSALSSGLGPVRSINIEKNILSSIGDQVVYSSQEGDQQQHAFELDEQNDRAVFSWMSDTTHIFASNNRFIDFPCAFVVGARQSLVHLDISNNHMKRIPINVFPYLSFLGELKMMFCGLIAVPSDIGCCRVLTTCNISHNSLSEIPSSIGYCARLETLNISHNTLRKLPDSLTVLRSLKTVNAEHNSLVHLHLWEANSMPCLQNLLLTSNKLRCIPLGLGKCPALQRLEYDFTEVWSPPAALHGLADVGGCASSLLSPEKGHKHTVSAHESMSVVPCSTAPLAFLSAWYECIVRTRSKLIMENLPFGSIPDIIFDDFSRYMKSISYIHMTHCDITTFSDRFLVIAPQIVSLNLSHNKLLNAPNSVKGMTQLTTLNLSYNQITVLPSWIASCSPKLQIDDVETFKNNPIVFPDTNLCATQPVAHLRVLNNLVAALQASDKRISLEGIAGASWDIQKSVDHAIITLVADCPLATIDLSKSLLKNVPPWICHGCRFSTLVSLNLNSNRLQTLPDVLSRFSCLAQLSAVHNMFSVFPAVVGLINALEECDLRGNDFNTVPIAIGEMTALRILKVDPHVRAHAVDGVGLNRNMLPVIDEASPATYFDVSPVQFQPLAVERTHDSVDMAFLRILSLANQSRRLYLGNQCLRGVPAGLMCLTTLTTLDLSNNALPSLPSWLSTLVCLTTFSAAGNELQEVPEFIDSLRSIILLNFQRNRLCRMRVSNPIADSLQCLLLSGNSLSGELPADVISHPLPHLSLLDVSNNALEKISEDFFSFLPLLRVLNVKKNGIKQISPRVVLCPMLQVLHAAGNFISFPPEVPYKPVASHMERLEHQPASKGPFEHRFLRDVLSAETFLSLDEMHLTTDFLREYSPANADSIMLETLRRLLPCDASVCAYENDVTRMNVTNPKDKSTVVLAVPHSSALVSVMPRLSARSLDMSCFELGCVPEFVFFMDVIVELHLRHCGIFDVSPALTILTNLHILDIASNNIKELPLALGCMHSLKMIDVVDNPINCPPKSVADQGPVQVKAFIKSLHDSCESRILNLQMLKLQIVPDVIMNMTPLNNLSLRQNSISAVPKGISLLTNLTRLDIGENSLIVVPRDLFSLVGLRELLLDHNSLTGISEHVAQLHCLELLDVSFNRIKEVPVPELAILRKINEIRLVGNKIGVPPEETQLYGGAACVRFLKSLQFSYSNGVLNLNDCNLTVIPDIVFSSNLQTRLLELHLDDNLLSNLPERLQHLLVLRVLSVRRNRIAALPTVILRLTSLTELRTAGNILTSIALPHSLTDPKDDAASEISVSLNSAAEMTAGCLLNVIRRLALSQASQDGVANLSRMSLVDVPQMVTDAQFVKELDLGHNSVDMLPVDIGNMASLRLLRVRNNLLRTLPESLLQLHMLEHLDCRCNGLTKLPYGMGRMLNLRTLLLGSNRLRFLPFDLGLLTRLSTLQICLNDSIAFPPQHLVGPLCFLGSSNEPAQESRKQVLIEAASKLTDTSQPRVAVRPLSAAEVVEIVQLDFGEYLTDMLDWMRRYGQRFENKGGQALLHVNEEGIPTSLTQAHDLDLSNLAMRECWPLFPPAPWKTVETLISVSLAHNELWEVPKSMLQCAFLKSMSLSSNRFDDLPEWLVEFKWLEKLALDDNNFNEIPSSVFEIGTLTTLSVSHNNLVVISESISKLDRLKTLSLSNNRLRELPQEVGGLVELETLEYANNLIATMMTSTAQLQKLKVLNAACNKIQHVPDELAACTSLMHLDLTKNPLQHVSPLIFLSCTCLQEILLHEIQTLDFPPRQIVSSFSQLLRYEINSAIASCSGILDASRFDLRVINVYALESLLLRDTSLRAAIHDLIKLFHKFNSPNKEGVVEPWCQVMRAASGEFIGKWRLLEINVDGNAGLHQVIISSRAAASLQVVSVSECSLQSAAWPFVVFSDSEANRKNDLRPEVLEVKPTPEESVDELSYREVFLLNLSRNKLSRVPAAIKFMRALRILDFCDNEVDILPEQLGQHCPLLEVLLMDRNQVSVFCDSIQNLNRLRRLSCAQNQLNCLPDFIGRLTSLTELNLERNSICNFPIAMGTLTQLTNLVIEWDHISYIPDDIKASTATQQIRYIGSFLSSRSTSVLDISGFGLHEMPIIPTELLDGPPIKSVNLGRNFLEKIPVWLVQLRDLTDLNISNNRLTELNPHVMGHLSHLKTLDISGNTVIGFLPSSVAFCKELVSINIEHCSNWVFPPVSIVKLGGNAILRFLSAFTGESEKVDMSELALSELPSDMRTFEQAKVLWLDYNHLTSLPASIGKCKNLTSLSVANNFLTELPSELGFCDSLIQLNVSGNKDLLSLPATLRNLSKLTHISVDENIRYPPPSIARKGSEGIRDFYARFDGLVPYGMLDLSKLHLESIPYDAIDARSLGNIILSNNPLGLHQIPLRNVELLGTIMCLELASCDLQALPIEMAQLSCLQRLNLQNNMLSVVDACVLQLTAMVNIDLSGNLLRSITGLFSALSELIACDLSGNKITFHQDDFEGALRLQSLNISKNSVDVFPESIGCMRSLQSLYANHCRISFVPAAFMLLAQLHDLSLDGNQIMFLPPWFAFLYNKSPPLKTFSLRENPLDPAFQVCVENGTIETLVGRLQAPLMSHMEAFEAASKNTTQHPKELCGDFYLRFISAVGTAFGSKLDLSNLGFVEFPSPCLGYSDITHVTLDSNTIGEIPHHISKLTRLVSLSARASSVTHVHDHLVKCTTLTSLSLSYNNLATLPPSVGNMSSLVVLDLSNNKSIGFVALTAMFQLLYVKTLAFNHCNLSQLPTEFAGCRRLTALNVSNNNLVAIPLAIGFCRQLSVFDFSANSVSQIPESLGMCTNLATLKLAANMVRDIPPHVGLLTNLTVLDISNNPMQPVITAMFDLCGMSLGLTFLRQIYYCLKNLNRGDEERSPDAEDSSLEDVALHKLLEGGGNSEMDLSGFKLQAWPPQMCPSSSVCILHRIEHVVSLNLSNNELCEVPEHISCIVNLKCLNLARNKIVSIHGAMSALTQLNSLDLSCNKLTQVSSIILDMTTLTSLNMLENPICRLPVVPDQWPCFSSIRQLSIKTETRIPLAHDENCGSTDVPMEIVGSGDAAVKRYLSRMANAVYSDSIDITSSLLWQVPDSVLKIAALQRLYIGGNFIRALPENISSLKSLRELVAPDNYLVELPRSLVQLTALERLTLSNNRIRIVPSVYGHITSLTALELIGNPLDSPPISLYSSAAANALAVTLNYLLRVEEAASSNRLDFSRIYLDANAMIHLPASIVDKCQSVMLRSNNYTLVPKFVLEMRSVQLLDLSQNLLSALPHAFGNLTNIRTLNLCNNKFVAWPATTFAQTGITMLNLSQNKLEMIPREVGLFHTVLKSLNLSQNCIVNLPLAQSILTFVVSLEISNQNPPESHKVSFGRRVDEFGKTS